MSDRPHFKAISTFVRDAAEKSEQNQVKVLLTKFGAINVRSRQRIAEVPFLFPTLVLVIRGKKSIYYQNVELLCSAGNYLAIPAPSNFDVINSPVDAFTSFMALYLHFDLRLVARFRRLYQFEGSQLASAHSIRVEGNQILDSAVYHYLEITQRSDLADEIVEHRLMEILLSLVSYNKAGHMLLSMSPKWSERVYSLLLSDPSKVWLVKDVCELLSVSESTLRRNLRDENTNFRSILDEIRMAQALSAVQFTQLPISVIANNCGYSSFSQFTTRFRQRFEATPTQLRMQMAEIG